MRKSRVILYFIIVFLLTLLNFYFRPIEKNPLITESFKKSKSYVNNLYKSEEYFKKKLLQKNEYYLYEQMIRDVLEGVSSNTISCQENCLSIYHRTFDALILDHPELISFQNCYTRIGNDSISITYHPLGSIRSFFGTRRIERELSIVREETKNMNDKEKILYVYDYVAHHNYDYIFMYQDSNQSAYSFFTKGSSVCAGFAKASQILFQNIGISSYLVMTEDHMWNYVQYEGKYYVFDATMGASLTIKSNAHFYDGLGETTIQEYRGNYFELYPEIETDNTLKKLFDIGIFDN